MRRILVYVITVFAFFVVGLLVANFIIMPLIVRQGKAVSVPNVMHLPLDAAVEELHKHGLEGVVVERRYDAVVKKDQVIIQDPIPEAKVKKGRIINLTLSLGPETVRVPFLIGVDIEKGKLILKRIGFTIKSISYIYSDSVAREKIIETLPEADVELKKGDAIQLVVSKGSVIKMPNLTGKKLDEAKTILADYDLILGEIKEVEGSGTKGSIIVQNPTPDQVVEPGDTVTIMVIK